MEFCFVRRACDSLWLERLCPDDSHESCLEGLVFQVPPIETVTSSSSVTFIRLGMYTITIGAFVYAEAEQGVHVPA